MASIKKLGYFGRARIKSRDDTTGYLH